MLGGEGPPRGLSLDTTITPIPKLGALSYSTSPGGNSLDVYITMSCDTVGGSNLSRW